MKVHDTPVSYSSLIIGISRTRKKFLTGMILGEGFQNFRVWGRFQNVWKKRVGVFFRLIWNQEIQNCKSGLMAAVFDIIG